MDIAVTLAKNHEQSLVIDVPVTAISNATGFDGYQVIVMPSENRTIEEEEPTKFSSSGPGNVEISVVNSYAKKAAAMRQNRLQLQCSRCDYKCLTPLLMSFHCKSINCKTTYVEKLILAKQYKLTIFFLSFSEIRRFQNSKTVRIALPNS